MQKLLGTGEPLRKPIGVLMMDIDFFKKINDTYGHDVGDQVLKEFARRMTDNLRSFDLVARTGGEEFVAILPDITEERARFVAERLRRSVADAPFACSAPEGTISVTTSIGGAIVTEGGQNMVDVLKRADEGLYQAKHSGRNCTVFEGIGKLAPETYHQEERSFD